LIVIELGNCADWPPAIRGMAILTGDRQGAVRTMTTFGGLRSRASPKSGKGKKQDDNKFRCNGSAHDVHLAFVLSSLGIRKTWSKTNWISPSVIRSPNRLWSL